MSYRRLRNSWHKPKDDKEESRTKFLPAREFLNLAISRRKLLRSDEDSRAVRGLLDVETGTRYLIEETTLNRQGIRTVR